MVARGRIAKSRVNAEIQGRASGVAHSRNWSLALGQPGDGHNVGGARPGFRVPRTGPSKTLSVTLPPRPAAATTTLTPGP